MERLDGNVCSLQSTLDQTPEVFQPVGVHLPVNVFLRVVNDFMREVLPLQSLIGHEGIGVDRAASLDVSAYIALYCVLLPIWNHHCANFAATLQYAHYRCLVLHSAFSNHALLALRVHETGRATDEGFVYFDVLPFAAHLAHAAAL